MGEIVIDFIQKNANLIVYFLSLSFFLIILTSAETRQDIALQDQSTKSATVLTVEADGGSNTLSAQQVLCDIYTLPDSVAIQVNEKVLTNEIRTLAKDQKVAIHLPDRTYTACYTYDSNGEITKVTYK